MELHSERKTVIDAGVHGHLITIGADGRPLVTMVCLGRDGDDVLVAHLGNGQKLRNVDRDQRLAVSLEVESKTAIGLDHYAVLHGTGTITEGGAAELLQEVSPRFMGAGVKFPPMDNPPPGRILHIAIERVTGAGPWAN